MIFQPAILVATIGYKHFLGKTTASVETSVVRPWVFKCKGWRAVFFFNAAVFSAPDSFGADFFFKAPGKGETRKSPHSNKKTCVCVS